MIVVPFPSGGSADVMGRSLAHFMGTKLSVTLLAENKSGSDGLLSVAYSANASHDVYTLGML